MINSRLISAVARTCATIVEMRAGVQAGLPSDRAVWHELVACILGSQIRFETAIQMAMAVSDLGMPDQWGEAAVNGEILGRLRHIVGAEGRQPHDQTPRHRFPEAKASQLWLAASHVRRSGLENIADKIREDDPSSARAFLVREVAGLGPKQASLFLRNVGRANDMAILDRHVLKYMQLIGLIKSERENVQTLRAYERVEAVFVAHCTDRGWSVADYDLAVWAVMRVAARNPVCQLSS
jgi:N-glycosylase/DNA lyase